MGPADGRDQRVEARDWFPGPFAAASNDCVMVRGCGIDRQDLVGEGREDLVGRGEEDLLPAPVGQPGNTVPDLCERDGGRTQLAPVRSRTQLATHRKTGQPVREGALMNGRPTAAAGKIDVGGDLTVNRLGFRAMRITGPASGVTR